MTAWTVEPQLFMYVSGRHRIREELRNGIGVVTSAGAVGCAVNGTLCCAASCLTYSRPVL